MAARLEKGISRAASRVGNLLGRKSTLGREGSRGLSPLEVVRGHPSMEDLYPESTPLSVRAQVDYSTVLDPQIRTDRNWNSASSDHEQKGLHFSPEDHLKLFAFRIASIEKAATGVSTLAFLFATVVILGGFATSLTFEDFWVVAVIISAEALRIFTRSHELEWQLVTSRAKGLETLKCSSRSGKDPAHTLPSSASDVEASSASASGASDLPNSRARRRLNLFKEGAQISPKQYSGQAADKGPELYRVLSRQNVSVVSEAILIIGPIVNKLLRPPVMRALLYILQLISAAVCIGLSIWRLLYQEFCFRNQEPASTALKAANATLTNNFTMGMNELGNLTRSDLNRCPDIHQSVAVCMNLFFCMAILEASLFLLEKGYFEFRWTFRNLLKKVQKNLSEDKRSCKRILLEDPLKEKPVDSSILESFYYTVYTNCLKGSILDALDMSLVGYSIQWLQSEDLEQQLLGARLLRKFVSHKWTPKVKGSHADVDPQTEDALRRLSRTPGIIDRLMEMLAWNSEQEKELVCEVAIIVKCLVAYDHNWSRLTAVPGALDAVVSILIPGPALPPREKESTEAYQERRKAAYSKQLHLQLMGLKILRSLCQSFASSLNIGETRCLLPILVLFLQPQGSELRYLGDKKAYEEFSKTLSEDDRILIDKSRWKVYKTSLQVLSYLAANKSNSGAIMRMQIAGIVSVLKNLRDTIEHCGPSYADKSDLLELSMDTLLHLALEDSIRRSIGATGGMIRLLFNVFQVGLQDNDAEQNRSKLAGKVLSRLMLHSDENCSAFLALEDDEGRSSNVVNVMIETFSYGKEDLAVSAAEVLLRVLKYADEDTKREIALRGGLKALQNISEPNYMNSKSRVHEASLGLWSRALQALALSPDPGSDHDVVSKWIDRIKREDFLSHVVKNLRHSPTTSIVPKIRRYSLEIIIALMEMDEYFLHAFVRLGLRAELRKTLDTISEVENVILFSGLMAYDRHSEDIRRLVLRCIAALGQTGSSKSPLPRSRDVAG